jgi:hypothetical protein
VPLLTAASLTLTTLAPPGCSTEAVGWMSSAIRLGLATGTALAAGLGGPFTLPMPATALCTLLLTTRSAPHPRRPPPDSRPHHTARRTRPDAQLRRSTHELRPCSVGR